jgi:ABC-type molybdate transport system substrate-binding protein
MRSFIVAAAIATTLLFPQGHATAAEIKVLSVVPLKTSLDELGPRFERATGHKLTVAYDGSSQLKRRLEAGEAFDVALIYPIAVITTPFIAMEPGADLVGPLPDELQQLIVYTAAIGSAAKEPDPARALIKHLTTPEAAKLLKSNGLDPPGS